MKLYRHNLYEIREKKWEKYSSSCIAASLLWGFEVDYDLEDSGSRGALTQAINNSPGGRAISRCYEIIITVV